MARDLSGRPRLDPRERAMLAALVLLGGCVSDRDADGTGAVSAEYAEHDSAGIVIAVTPGQVARADLGWEVSATPDLVIGGMTGEESADSAQIFQSISGVRQLTNGGVVVLDRGFGEVRFFDARGRFLRRLGRRGRGPGEFQLGPFLVPGFHADSLLLFDQRLDRFHVLSGDGDHYRVVTPDDRGFASRCVGIVGRSVLAERSAIMIPRGEGPLENPVTYAWVDIATGARIPVDSFAVHATYITVRDGGSPSGHRIPFSSRPAAAVARSRALVTEAVSPEIKEYDVEARLRRIIRLAEPSRPVAESDIRRYDEATEGQRNPTVPIPETMPSFRSLIVDDDGLLLAQV